MQAKFKFPKNFLWGASTASHQVEGGTYNQWTVWELEHASELAKAAEKHHSWTPVWSEIKTQATDPSNYISGKGVEHYRLYKEDFDILKNLNLDSFRFGIEWSRLEPAPGEWNDQAVAHYKDYIVELKKRGIEPVVNLWHWTIPVWFAEMGGFEKRANRKYWDAFVAKVASELLDGITYVITLNEPNVYTSDGYLSGKWVPQLKSPVKAMQVYWNLVRAHKSAYKILKAKKPSLQIGIAAQLANIQAKRPHNFLDELITKVMRYGWNWWFLNRIKNQQDFLGFNYYFTDYYEFGGRRPGMHRLNPNMPKNDLGWYMEPEGLYPLLLRAWTRYKKPIIITENGLADRNDQYRQWWLEETMVAMERALSEGVDLRGYFHWSLLDNFEWSYGWWPNFGLVAVDREHGMKRTIRKSALWWAEQLADLKKQD